MTKPAADLASFRAQIDIVEAAEKLGLAVRRSGAGGVLNCPFHDDADPSCSLDSLRGRFRCWSGSCEERGDVIDLVRRVRGDVSFGEAIDWLASEFGVAPPARSPEATAHAAALRTLSRGLVERRDGALPAGISEAAATALGLGRAVELAELAAQLAKPLWSAAEVERWAGCWTLELSAKGGLAGVGAFVPDGEDELARFELPASLRMPALAGLAAARPTINRQAAVLVAPGPRRLLELASAGLDGVVAPPAELGDEIAAMLVGLARRVILIWPAERARDARLVPQLVVLLRAGARVELAFDSASGLSAPVPVFAYLARAVRDSVPERREKLLRACLDALPSPSTRALYAADLTRQGLLAG